MLFRAVVSFATVLFSSVSFRPVTAIEYDDDRWSKPSAKLHSMSSDGVTYDDDKWRNTKSHSMNSEGVTYDDDKWQNTKSHSNGVTFDDDKWHKEGFTYDDDRWHKEGITFDDEFWYGDDHGSSSSSSSDSQDCKSIAEMVCSMSELTILCHAIERTGLYHHLDDLHTDYTLFAPRDSAFHGILNNNLHVCEDIHHCPLDNFFRGVLTTQFHVGGVITKDLLEDRCRDLLEMGSGENTRTICDKNKHEIFQKGGGNKDNEKPKIVLFDIDTCNGIIHVVDRLILPKLKEADLRM